MTEPKILNPQEFTTSDHRQLTLILSLSKDRLSWEAVDYEEASASLIPMVRQARHEYGGYSKNLSWFTFKRLWFDKPVLIPMESGRRAHHERVDRIRDSPVCWTILLIRKTQIMTERRTTR